MPTHPSSRYEQTARAAGRARDGRPAPRDWPPTPSDDWPPAPADDWPSTSGDEWPPSSGDEWSSTLSDDRPPRYGDDRPGADPGARRRRPPRPRDPVEASDPGRRRESAPLSAPAGHRGSHRRSRRGLFTGRGGAADAGQPVAAASPGVRRLAWCLAGVLAALVVTGFVVRGGDELAEDPPRDQPVAAGPGAGGVTEQHSDTPAGDGTFGFVKGTGDPAGAEGKLHRYRVAVEKGSGADAADFSAVVEAVLADARGWTAGATDRFQRVDKNGQHEFTVYLATPATAAKMCAAGGLHTGEYTNCRVPGQIIINIDRWSEGIPAYPELGEYRAYALNHEVGHQLGLKHEACPGAGRPAPVMLQQTLGLDGCSPQAWPYLDGDRYEGPQLP